jgi:multicomponent Na+:H+ antiporter subunit E
VIALGSYAWRRAAARAVGFFVVWLALSGGAGADLVPGAAAALFAGAASLLLLPAGKNRIAPVALARYALRFLGRSVLAGADVARRALDPHLPLRPGLVSFATAFAPGPARNLFTTLTSLLPGTVPIATDAGGALVIHCLDTSQPIAAAFAAEEAALSRVIGSMIGRAPGGG